MFDTLNDKFDKIVCSIRGKAVISEADLDSTIREIRIALLEADVALTVVKQFTSSVKDKILGKLTITKKISFLKPLAKIIYKFLGNKSNLFESNFFTKKQLKEIKKIYSKKNNILDKRYNLSLKKYGYFTSSK